VAVAAATRQLEHRPAAVDADDRAVGPDLVEQLGAVEPRATAHVEHTLSWPDCQRLAHDPAPANGIPDEIDRLDLPGHVLIEYELAHVPFPRPERIGRRQAASRVSASSTSAARTTAGKRCSGSEGTRMDT
jgi:hypothetical protein